MPWALYGKRTEPILNTETHQFMGPDSTFRALDARGVRVNKLEDCMAFATKEDAEAFLANKPVRKGVKIEIRKVK